MVYLAVGGNDIQQRHDPVWRGKFVIIPLRILTKRYQTIDKRKIEVCQHIIAV